MKWINLITQSDVVPDHIGSTYNPASNVDLMVANNWRMWDEEDTDTLTEGNVLVSQSYTQHPEKPNNAWRTMVQVTQEEWDAEQAAAEAARQAAKPDMLKLIENLYIGFLTNEWTPVLRTKEIIAPDFTITVENTGTATNMAYLMALRQMDLEANKPTYNYYAGEFSRFKSTVEGLGGTMSDIIYHA